MKIGQVIFEIWKKKIDLHAEFETKHLIEVFFNIVECKNNRHAKFQDIVSIYLKVSVCKEIQTEKLEYLANLNLIIEITIVRKILLSSLADVERKSVLKKWTICMI